MNDLAPRLAKRIQLTTDCWKPYPMAVDIAFGGAVDYAVLNKTYNAGAPTVEAERRYSPPVFVRCTKEVVLGKLVDDNYLGRSTTTILAG